MARYYVHDLESDKLCIHTGGKADWLTIPKADRNAIKRCCLWSNSRACWVGRRKGRFIYCEAELQRNGFEYRGEEGKRLSFVESVQAEQEKAEARAERMESRAEKAESEAKRRFAASRAIVHMIPMGQPILIGHHSEGRHRRDLAQSDNHMRKGCEAQEKRDHYQNRAEAARATADGFGIVSKRAAPWSTAEPLCKAKPM